MIERWSTRPVEVEAIVFDGTVESRSEIEQWSGMDLTTYVGARSFEAGDAIVRFPTGFRVVKAESLGKAFER